MAWNEPGNRGEAPWGKKRPAGKSGGLDEAMKNWQQRLQSILGGGGGSDAASQGTAPVADACTRTGSLFAGLLVLLWLASGFFQINASDKGVVQRFGKFSRGARRGLGLDIPLAHREGHQGERVGASTASSTARACSPRT